MLKGFKDFLIRGNVIDLAVGIIMGTAFTAVVTALGSVGAHARNFHALPISEL